MMNTAMHPSRRLAAALFAVVAMNGAAPAQQAVPAAVGAASPVAARASPYHAQKLTHKAEQLYLTAWGVDKLKVSYTSSGNLIRFSYRVENPERAKALTIKSATPYLIGQRARAVLQVPTMDQVGQLRQSATEPRAGAEYWMVFSNKGNLVRPGDRVNVQIGSFHADGLMVE